MSLQFGGFRFGRRRRPNIRPAAGAVGRLESLERRELLAGDVPSAWQNPLNRLDVNADGRVSPSDVLWVINDLNENGARQLSAQGPTSGAAALSDGTADGFLDVDGNGRVSASDVLTVINALNAKDADDILRIQVRTTDLSGAVITSIDVGTEFYVEILTQDLRPSGTGVFSAFTDVLYASNLVSVTGNIEPGSDYANGAGGNTNTVGVIDEVGGFTGSFNLNTDPRRLARVKMRANTAGSAAFTADAPDLIDSELALLNRPGQVPLANVEFISSTLNIVNPGQPTISIEDASAIEGNSGTSSLVFVLTLSEASTSAVTVNFATADDTATAGADYVAANGTITFAPGETTKTVFVTVNGDGLDEANETMRLALTSPVGASLARTSAVGTILDDDVTTIFINNASVLEGNSGTTQLNFTVSLSGASGQMISVDFGTSNGTATAPTDYLSNSGSLTFLPGETTKTVTVLVQGDTEVEPAETLNVTLANAVNALISTTTGVGTIQNDDESGVTKVVNIRAVATNAAGTPITSITEGNSFFIDIFVDDLRLGTADQGVFSAYLDLLYSANLLNVNGAIQHSASYPDARTGNIATDGLVNDLGATAAVPPTPLGSAEIRLARVPVIAEGAGTATFTPGPSGNTVVNTLLFGRTEPVVEAETTFVPGSITINPIVRTLSIGNASNNEGNIGTEPLFFMVQLSQSSTQAVTFTATTASGTATTGSDFVAVNTQFTIPAGQTSVSIPVSIVGDTVFEPNETFTLTISNASGATIANAVATGTIVNDDESTGFGSIAGSVYADTDNNGFITLGERGIKGILIRLVGTGESSDFMTRETRTNDLGDYSFADVPTGTYELQQVQSVFFMDGIDHIVGENPGVAGNDVISEITVTPDSELSGYQFGEWGVKAQFFSKKLLLTSFDPATWMDDMLADVGTMIAFDEGVEGALEITALSQQGAVGLQVLNASGQVIGGTGSLFGEASLMLNDTNGEPIVVRVTGSSARLSIDENLAAGIAIQQALTSEDQDN